MKTQPLKAPFPWFGGKSRACDLIWTRLGDVANYVEPFAGSLAVLLGRPHWPYAEPHTETVNDADRYVANFWRALLADPDAVCHYADWPVNEADLHARHTWLHAQSARVEALHTDPGFYDARVAGYWVWGISSWIGDNFCRPTPQAGLPHLGPQKGIHRKRPEIGNAGKGINRKLPHIGDHGKGINRQLPHIGNHGKGINRQLPHIVNRTALDASPAAPAGACAERRANLLAYFADLADRLRGVRVCCGDWTRVLGSSPTWRLGLTGILLDPPYALDSTRDAVYGERDTADIWPAVCAWCAENGGNPLLRIALCGYEGGFAAPPGWHSVAWRAGGGYGNQAADNANRHRERIWFSPACIQPEAELFS